MRNKKLELAREIIANLKMELKKPRPAQLERNGVSGEAARAAKAPNVRQDKNNKLALALWTLGG
jgi:hypothetical protein